MSRQIVNNIIEKTIKETTEKAIREAIQKAINEAIQKGLNETLQKTLSETLQKSMDDLLKKGLGETVEKSVKETVEKSVKNLSPEMAERVAKSVAETATKNLLEKPIKEITEKTLKETGQKLDPVLKESLEKSAKESAGSAGKQTLNVVMDLGKKAIAAGIVGYLVYKAIDRFKELNGKEFVITKIEKKEKNTLLYFNPEEKISTNDKIEILNTNCNPMLSGTFYPVATQKNSIELSFSSEFNCNKLQNGTYGKFKLYTTFEQQLLNTANDAGNTIVDIPTQATKGLFDGLKENFNDFFKNLGLDKIFHNIKIFFIVLVVVFFLFLLYKVFFLFKN